MVDGVPDNLRIDRKVRVHQTVAHGPHQMPWHLRVRSLDLFRDMARGFADNDEVKLDGPHSFGIIPQRVECYPLCEGFDFSDRVQNIPYALAPGSRRHQCSPLTPSDESAPSHALAGSRRHQCSPLTPVRVYVAS